MSFEEEVRAFLERMGYTNVEQDVETNQLSADFWPPAGYIIWNQRSIEGGWQVPQERRLIRYRRTKDGIYQEVYEEPSGHIFYGLYMPEGFVPPKEEHAEQE